MDQESIDELLDKIKNDISSLNLSELRKTSEKLRQQSELPGLWDDNIKATKIMQEMAQINETIEIWESLLANAQDLKDLQEIGDDTLADDINTQFAEVCSTFKKLHIEATYNGPFDNHNALLNIHAGAGGTDAQDWTSMLLRMYSRWAESSGYKIRILDESAGEEAGIKSVSLAITGRLAYGKLNGEGGVHRLVRLSPYNANNLRQTSFAKVEVYPEIDQPDMVPLDDKDLKIDVYRAGGHGGQSVNTTDSAVRVTHLPTGITVSIQNERSQLQNKETALTILRSKLARLQIEQHAEKISQLKGPNQSAEWGNQIRSYVLHPYNMVKDLRTKYETSDTGAVLDGDINEFINAYSSLNMSS